MTCLGACLGRIGLRGYHMSSMIQRRLSISYCQGADMDMLSDARRARQDFRCLLLIYGHGVGHMSARPFDSMECDV